VSAVRTQAGIDLVDVDEVRAAIAEHGERYLQRLFTPAERAAAADRPRRLAATLAAKEATFKALAARADAATVWQDVEITPPRARLRGALLRAHPDAEVTISESGNRHRALAVAIVEAR
jgi:holo-[acyl-carrier protein] synthase